MNTRSLVFVLRNAVDGDLKFEGYYETELTFKGKPVIIRFNAESRFIVDNGEVYEDAHYDVGDDVEIALKDKYDETSFNAKDIFKDSGERVEFLREIMFPDNDVRCDRECEYSEPELDVEFFVKEGTLSKETYNKICEKLGI